MWKKKKLYIFRLRIQIARTTQKKSRDSDGEYEPDAVAEEWINDDDFTSF